MSSSKNPKDMTVEERKKHVREMMSIPKKEPSNAEPHLPQKGQLPKNLEQQADLLYLPKDTVDGKTYRYVLVVVDFGSRIVDARPLTGKTADVVKEAILDIYDKENRLKWPKELHVDDGSEFKSVFAETMKDHDVLLHVAQPDRHSQQAVIEAVNHVIGKLLFEEMNSAEFETGETSREWVKHLEDVLEKINKKRKKMPNVKPIDPYKPPKPEHLNKSQKPVEMLEENTRVRVALDAPRGVAENEKLHGHFRAGDIRYENKIRTIERVVLTPESPVRYLVSGKDNVSYTRSQLMVVH